MKTSKVLYVLLVFLILSNIFFLFHFLEKPKHQNRKPKLFLAKALDFNKDQMVLYKKLSDPHFKKMEIYSKDIKILKDKLFSKLSDKKVSPNYIDSITQLIGKKEQQKDIEVFNHMRAIRQLCNNEQKEKFLDIVFKALRRGPPDKKHPRRK